MTQTRPAAYGHQSSAFMWPRGLGAGGVRFYAVRPAGGGWHFLLELLIHAQAQQSHLDDQAGVGTIQSFADQGHMELPHGGI